MQAESHRLDRQRLPPGREVLAQRLGRNSKDDQIGGREGYSGIGRRGDRRRQVEVWVKAGVAA